MRTPDRSIRIAVTGLGIVSSIGRNQQELWRAIVACEAGIAPLTRFAGESFPTDIAAEVADFDLPFSRRDLRRLSRTDLLAVAAAHEAKTEAESAAGALPLDRTMVCTGSSTGGLAEGETYYFDRLRRGRERAAASRVLQQPTSGPSDAVARLLGLGGGVITNATACASAGAAIGIGADMLRSGQADAVVAGGSDALCRVTYSGFNVLQAVDPNPCSPFAASRAGITLGEGAAWLVLERWDEAIARGAAPLAELAGWGASCDAHHPTAPAEDGSGAAAALRAAFAEAGIEAGDVDYVNAHGTGTQLNDAAETKAIIAALGTGVPVSSTKSYFGHTLGASGALEAVVTILAMRNRLAPPTLRLTRAADECTLDYIPNQPRAMDIRVAVSNTFGFGGSNVSLVFRSAEASE
jgi:3-oxoacyl-[acyl-carrier-protein] synthase II